MPAFDSIVNVEEWISDHYLTTDETKGASFSKRVAERIKLWKTDEEASNHVAPLSRFNSERLAIQTSLATLADTPSEAGEAAALIRKALGYGSPTIHTAHRGADAISYTAWVGNAGSVALLEAQPIEAPEEISSVSLLERVEVGGKEQDLSAAQLIGQLFLSDTPASFIICTAGSWIIVAERDSWPLGRYLAIDLALVVERNDTKSKGEIQQAVVALARENTERSADGTTWWDETIEQSREHAIQVSGELRGSVRDSIEIIGNDVLDRYREQGLSIDDIDGGELAKQTLRYLYRILFLLFAEASPELEILPTGTPGYDEGYGLSRLRELILDPPVTQHARTGTHLYESLQLLFTLVDKGHNPLDENADNHDPAAGESGLPFRNLSADLFLPSATNLIDRVKLSNEALNKVLENLLLSKEKSGKDRGFISYATLGVTELGQVYEGLMSYTGFIAQEDLFEVAPDGKADKGSWMLPVSRVDEVPPNSFVEREVEAGGGFRKERRRHPRGSFVFRQSSRDRERSASFYTPQVLTSFTVGQAIEELKTSGRIASANDILTLTICEPAMGSGAFAVETVRQLAELYLKMRQEELGVQVPAEDRAKEFQKIKAHIALHQVYGVDLNSTAVELAEISLWLDTMNAEMDAPWYGLHLRHGNSLVGATRSLYSVTQLNKKTWLTESPERKRLDDLANADENLGEGSLLSDGIHHFLLPSTGWGAPADAKDLKDLVPDEIKTLKAWRLSIRKALTKAQIKKVQNLALRVETLWRYALLRIQIAENQVSRTTNIWGQEFRSDSEAVTRDQIEQDLFGNQNGAFNRLRLIMNTWCAFWYWPLNSVKTESSPERPELPDMDEWLDTLTEILGVDVPLKSSQANQIILGEDLTWLDLNNAENLNIKLSGAKPIPAIFENHRWLTVAKEVAKEQAFFHWDLDFAEVFASGGFDLQVGNPPWVRPDINFEQLLAETDPWWTLAHKPSQADKKTRLSRVLDGSRESISTILSGAAEATSTAAILGSTTLFPHLKDQRPDMYRGFMERTWSNASNSGVVSLIHPESHFTEKKAAPLRRGAYLRLRRHWQFINALMLFDIDDHVVYGVHVYASLQITPRFLMAARMYHPDTASDSLHHDGTGPLPGIKDENFNWDRRPHKNRIQVITIETLEVWKSILEDSETPALDSRMVYTVNTEAAAVLRKISSAPRMKELGLQFSSGWNETTDKKKGYFDVGWKHPESWSDVILQGPHLGISTPMIKQPNPTLKHNQDWSEVDLEALPEDFIPATGYQPNRADKCDYDTAYGTWTTSGHIIPVASTYRIAWREFAATTGFRTLYPAIIPPGTAHVNAVNSCRVEESNEMLPVMGAFMSSILADYFVRSAGTGHIFNDLVRGLPFAVTSGVGKRLSRLFLRLNCLTAEYAPLWEELTGDQWTPKTPLRNPLDRQLAQIEIDVLVAQSLGVTVEELCMIYRTQFPVMNKYDNEYLFDKFGRLVPKQIVKAESQSRIAGVLSTEDRTWIHPHSGVEYVFEYPFHPLDREAEITKMRQD